MKHKEHNILVLTYWSFNDALIQTYTLPYLRIIAKNLPNNSKIFLLTFDKIKKKSNHNENNIYNIHIQYQRFGYRGIYVWLSTIIKLIYIIKKEKITTIHAWCTPAGMMGYILSIITGKKLVIDSYEPHAEAMVENGTWKKNSLAFKLLFKFEKLQTKRATYLIATTRGMVHYAKTKYNHTKNNFYVKPACVDLELFSNKNKKNALLLKKLNLENFLICVYAGKLGGIYLDKEVFDFFKIAEEYWGEKFKALILSSHTESEIEFFRKKSGVKKETIIHLFINHSEVPDYIGLGDFGITPVKPVPTKKYCTPIKNGEYWALGLPVVITDNISDDSEIIKKYNIGSILKKFDKENYLQSVIEIDSLLFKYSRMELYDKIRPIAENYRNFNIAEKIYKEIYGDKK